jgi:hypothetical protein
MAHVVGAAPAAKRIFLVQSRHECNCLLRYRPCCRCSSPAVSFRHSVVHARFVGGGVLGRPRRVDDNISDSGARSVFPRDGRCRLALSHSKFGSIFLAVVLGRRLLPAPRAGQPARPNQTMKLTATAVRFGDAVLVATFLSAQACLFLSGRSLSFSR